MKKHNRILALCWTAYAFAYFGRVNLSVAIPHIQGEYGYLKAELGIVAGGFFGFYAAGQLINGMLGDRFHPRGFVALGLIVSSLGNLLMCITGSLMGLFVFWSLNGYFQSMLWGPIVRTLSNHTPPEKLGRAAFLLSTSMPVGYLVSYSVVGRIAAHIGWRWSFLAPGILLGTVACFWFIGLRGLPGRPDTGAEGDPPYEAEPRDSFFRFILRSRLWVIALLCVLMGTVKEGISLWGPSLLSEAMAVGTDRAMDILTFVPVLNFLGLLLSARVNKRLAYREKRTMILFLGFSLLSAAALGVCISAGLPGLGITISFACLSAALFGMNNMLVVYTPMNFHKAGRISSTAGFIDSAIYLGAAVSGPVLGALADRMGWPGVTLYWATACCAGLTLAFFSRDYKAAPQS